MFDHRAVAFRMPSGLPAASAAFVNEETFVAVDGRSNEAALFCADGTQQALFCTLRPYRVIRRSTVSPTNGLLYALGSCNVGTPSRVYLLNCRFEEVGSFDLLTDTCAPCENAFALADIAPTGVGVHATYRHSIHMHDLDGVQVGSVLPEDRSRELLRYTVSGTARALAFCKNGMRFVNVAEIGAVYLGAPPDGLAVRDLLPYGVGDVYGLFGYRYLYNYLMPVYRNGSFCLPSDGTVGSVLQNIRACTA